MFTESLGLLRPAGDASDGCAVPNPVRITNVLSRDASLGESTMGQSRLVARGKAHTSLPLLLSISETYIRESFKLEHSLERPSHLEGQDEEIGALVTGDRWVANADDLGLMTAFLGVRIVCSATSSLP